MANLETTVFGGKNPSNGNICVINSPNLNLFGSREVDIYGHKSLDMINTKLAQIAHGSNITINCYQDNSEGGLIDIIQTLPHLGCEFFIFNPAGYTHTSVAIRDAVLAVAIPFLEVHISNICKRESFRVNSYFSDIAIGTITGLGSKGYELALFYAIDYLLKRDIVNGYKKN